MRSCSKSVFVLVFLFRGKMVFHLEAGVLAVLTPWLVLPFLKNPKPVWTIFKVRLTIRRSDLNNPSLLTAKLVI